MFIDVVFACVVLNWFAFGCNSFIFKFLFVCDFSVISDLSLWFIVFNCLRGFACYLHVMLIMIYCLIWICFVNLCSTC